MNESHGRSHTSLHCTTFRRPAYQMAKWPLKHGCCSSPSLDAGPPRLMWMDSRMPWWHYSSRLIWVLRGPGIQISLFNAQPKHSQRL